jgi:hypothetical protein
VLRHDILSADNAVFGLPNDETLARIILHGDSNPTIWFNYGTASDARWADPALRNRYAFDTMLPTVAQQGVALTVAARTKAP